MKKLFPFAILLMLLSGCKKQEAVPEEFDITHLTSKSWNIEKVQRRTLDSLNQEVAYFEKKYPNGELWVIFVDGEIKEIFDVLITTAWCHYKAKTDFPPPFPGKPHVRLDVTFRRNNSWFHSGKYYPALMTKDRFILVDTIRDNGLTQINTTTGKLIQ